MTRVIFLAILINFFSVLVLKAQDDSTSVYDETDEEVLDEDTSSAVSDSTQNFNSDEQNFKPQKKRSGKFLRVFEHFHFNGQSGLGLTRWRTKSFYYNDTTEVKYKGLGTNIPVHLQILYELGRLRIGAGASMELYLMKKLTPNKYEAVLPTFELKGIGTFRKFYGHIGYKYFQNRMYAYVADLEVGLYKPSKAYNTAGVGMRPFVNIGITLERKYSELFRVYLKPAVEFKGYPYNFPNNNLAVTSHRLMTFYAMCGISYSIPTVKKCPIKSCGIRVHHYHKDRLFRGNPFQRLQNPDYGEEDRKFIKMRGKNKKRLDPY